MDEAIHADRVIVIDDGNIQLQGRPKEVFSKINMMQKIGLDVPEVTKLASALKRLDEIHCSFMNQSGYSFLAPANFVVQMKEKTRILPTKVPGCERAILFSLILQIEMLDLVLQKQNLKKAKFLEEKRKRKKILSKSKRIFGDWRDIYIFLIIDLLGDISKLHHCFGVGSEINFNFPAEIHKADAVSYLIAKIKSVSLNADKLLNQNE